MISTWSVGKLWICSERTHQHAHEAHFERNSRVSFTICFKKIPEPLIESFFKKCPAVWSQFAHWVFFEYIFNLVQFLTKLKEWSKKTQWANCDQTAGLFLKKLSMSGSGIFLKQIVKETLEFLSKCALWACWCVLSEHIHNLPTDQVVIKVVGFFFKKFKTYPLGMWWVNCLKDHKKLSICPLGFTPFAPSGRSKSFGWQVHHSGSEWDNARCFNYERVSRLWSRHSHQLHLGRWPITLRFGAGVELTNAVIEHSSWVTNNKTSRMSLERSHV